MIDTNEMRNKLGDALVTPGLTVLALLDEIDRLRGKDVKPQGKTVRVKVVVAVDKDGSWQAGGGSWYSRNAAVDSAADGLISGEHIYWLTADLPVPEEVTVEAEVWE